MRPHQMLGSETFQIGFMLQGSHRISQQNPVYEAPSNVGQRDFPDRVYDFRISPH